KDGIDNNINWPPSSHTKQLIFIKNNILPSFSWSTASFKIKLLDSLKLLELNLLNNNINDISLDNISTYMQKHISKYTSFINKYLFSDNNMIIEVNNISNDVLNPLITLHKQMQIENTFNIYKF